MGSKKKQQRKSPPKPKSPAAGGQKEEKSPEPEPSLAVPENYGAAADAYAADDSSIPEEDEEEEDTSLEIPREEIEEKEESSDSEEEDSDDDNDDDDDDEEAEANQSKKVVVNPPAFVTDSEEPCSFDLRNLTAVNSHPLNHVSLFKKSANASNNKKNKKKQEEPISEEKLTINTISEADTLNEEYLLEKSTEGCTQLIQALWQLPTDRSDAGPMVHLPTYDKIPIPRALPPPAPKAETRWEKFAKERGLPLNKEKRSRKVWDEATNSWKFRHGFDKANADSSSNGWPIMEVGGNDDPFDDPWQKQRDAKFSRTEQNRENQLKNQERAGVLPKGTTRRVLKNRAQIRDKGKEGGSQGMDLPVGVPVDMTANKLRGKASTLAALKATQVSTASLGKFDRPLQGEPERKLPADKKKRKFVAEASTGKGSGKSEQERVAKVLQTVLQGGGVETEKARKKGKLAKGVTAYDYEYDDGGNKTMFSKKKGRGGMGKNKKMTKKRIK